MKGYLAMKGVHSNDLTMKLGGACSLNPTPYQADYMGQKIHMDQNEERVMFGVPRVKKVVLQCLLEQPVNLSRCFQNHVVERLRPEANNSVNYPLKVALLQMVEQEELNMDDSLVKYCVSNLTGRLCQIGLKRMVEE